ncbi:MAG: ParB/RepB/Spo0J family partition protein [Alteromonadaceae bacterium]|nr:ParB/RepB/Spo0J family partition protein [Alteromonadaceae bacterium]
MLDSVQSDSTVASTISYQSSKPEYEKMPTLPVSSLVKFRLGNTRGKKGYKKRNEIRSAIESHGIHTALIVRPSAEQEGMFEVLAGNTRWSIAEELGLPDVPVNIVHVDDKKALEINISENADREELNYADQARAAQTHVSHYEGDTAAAANALGWSEKKVKDRLQLNRCIEPVLDALTEEEISLGHAIVLSTFPENIQNGTLEKIKLEKWTVEFLKQRAGKAQRFLKDAIFDTSECEQCPHNSIRQVDMFSVGVDGQAKCSKLTCWQGKKLAVMEQKKEEATEKYGKVLLWIESADADRNTVTDANVGEAQFSEGCSNCESKAAIMDDREGKEGQIVENQCLDRVCFDKCRKKQIKAKAAEAKALAEQATHSDARGDNTDGEKNDDKAAQAAPTVATASQKTSTKKQVTANKDIESKISTKVTERERQTLRNAAATALDSDVVLRLRIMLSAIDQLSGRVSINNSVEDTLKRTKDADPKALQQEIQASITHFIAKKKRYSDGGFSNVGNCPEKTLLMALAEKDTAQDVAVSAWNADKDTLTNYTIMQIVNLCKEAGFIDAYDKDASNVDKKQNFSKLSKSGKGKLIEGIIGFNFDWSHYCPKTHLKHIS